MSIHDKRPAFPTEFTNDSDRNISLPDGQVLAPGCMALVTGMTVRQLYAGQALQGYLASCGQHTEPAEVASTIGTDCWKLADALIAAENQAAPAAPKEPLPTRAELANALRNVIRVADRDTDEFFQARVLLAGFDGAA